MGRLNSLLRLAEALAEEVFIVGAGRCELTAEADDEGRPYDHLDRLKGRCSGTLYAIRWEDGFIDKVCQKHAESASGRGAVVVRPARHDGTQSPMFPPQRDASEWSLAVRLTDAFF